ncbi:MAG TPA: hypothetical protein VMV10_26085 [Pirellulales bacterium]|nr:hypothetical protein [Pirellulales bacterium]HVB82226.1 hypothetical protein [Candidatus Binataceae bacterium]
MLPKLTPEQREALQRSSGRVPVEDEQTRLVYYIVDASRMRSIERQEDAAAIRAGIADMEAGRLLSIEDVDDRVHARIDSPSKE